MGLGKGGSLIWGRLTKPHRGPSAVQTGLPGTRISNTSLNSGDEAPSQPLLSPQPPGLFLELHPSEGAHPASPRPCYSWPSLGGGRKTIWQDQAPNSKGLAQNTGRCISDGGGLLL